MRTRNGSGYELARRFDRSIGYYWNAPPISKIYRTLRVMEGDGWVRVTPVAQHGRPDKKVYTVAHAGRAELARWIAEPLTGRGGSVADNRARDLAVKIRAAAHGVRCVAGPGRRAARRTRRITRHLPRIRETPVPRHRGLSGSALLHQYLVLRGGIRAEESAVDWLDEVAAAL